MHLLHGMHNGDFLAFDAICGGSSVTTEIVVRHSIQRALPEILLADLLPSRESLPLDTVIRLQRAFGVEVITPKDVLKQSESYVEYMFRNVQEA